jgi:hypothetical protein
LTPTQYKVGSLCIYDGHPNDTACGEQIYLLAGSPDQQSASGLHCLHNIAGRCRACFFLATACVSLTSTSSVPKLWHQMQCKDWAPPSGRSRFLCSCSTSGITILWKPGGTVMCSSFEFQDERE